MNQVSFFVDDVLIGTDSNGDDGWSLDWNTTVEEDGLHTVTATVTDASLQSSSDSVNVTVDNVEAVMHVADLDAQTKIRGKSGKWEVLVTVYIVDREGSPVSVAEVSGTWSGAAQGLVTGATDAGGAVTLATGNLSGGTIVTFTVSDVAHSTFRYDASLNIDPENDSDGTTITVSNDGATSRIKQFQSVLFQPALDNDLDLRRSELATARTLSLTVGQRQQEIAIVEISHDEAKVWLLQKPLSASDLSTAENEFDKPTSDTVRLFTAFDRFFAELAEEDDGVLLLSFE